MGAHRCCDCDDATTPAAFCGELVAGDPPSPCNWWPDAYDVSITVSGKIHWRRYQGSGASFNPNLFPCDISAIPQGGPTVPIPAGTQTLCTVVDYVWTLSTRIFRVSPTLGNDCGDGDCNGVLTSSPCPDEDANLGCDPDEIVYQSGCCVDNRATLSGSANRSVVSATGSGFFQLGQFRCVISAGSDQADTAFERFAKVTARCSTSVTNPSNCEPEKAARMLLSVGQFGNASGGQGQIGVDPACGSPTPGFDSIGYFSTPHALWQAPFVPPGDVQLSDSTEGWDVFPLYGFSQNICVLAPYNTGQSQFSDVLIIEQPGEPGEFQPPCNTYAGGCVPDGCDADLSGLAVGIDYQIADCSTGAPPGGGSYACHQVIMSATPVGGSA